MMFYMEMIGLCMYCFVDLKMLFVKVSLLCFGD